MHVELLFTPYVKYTLLRIYIQLIWTLHTGYEK
jgi:hypothetical protein